MNDNYGYNINYQASNNNNFNQSNNNQYNYNNYYFNDQNLNKNTNNYDIQENKKIKILCITWNIAGISSKNDYNIDSLFTENPLFYNNDSPNIIIINIQEIIKLSIGSVLTIVSNQENVDIWTENIISTLNRIYPSYQTRYSILKRLDLIGIYFLILVKNNFNHNVSLLDYNITKTGFSGITGNKGFITVSLKIFDKILCISGGHFEAGQDKNEYRIKTIKDILYKTVNLKKFETCFKDVDYWIILGDLNFRINKSFEDCIKYILKKNYLGLYRYDQFNDARKNIYFLQLINEATINFDPTYKYVKGTDNYDYDSDKIRIPSWTDRIFYCDKYGIQNTFYNSINSIKYSDHRPVVGIFEILCGEDKISRRTRSSEKYCQNKNNMIRNSTINTNMKREMEDIQNIINSGNDNNLTEINDDFVGAKSSKNLYYANKKHPTNKLNNKLNNNDYQQNRNNASKNNTLQVGMRYRGIDFNTEINLNSNNNNEIYVNDTNPSEDQNIFDFFSNSSHSNINNINNSNNAMNQDLLFNNNSNDNDNYRKSYSNTFNINNNNFSNNNMNFNSSNSSNINYSNNNFSLFNSMNNNDTANVMNINNMGNMNNNTTNINNINNTNNFNTMNRMNSMNNMKEMNSMNNNNINNNDPNLYNINNNNDNNKNDLINFF